MLGNLAYCCIPEYTAELGCFQKDWLGLIEVEVRAHGRIEAHCAKAGDRDLLVAEGKGLDHFGDFRV